MKKKSFLLIVVLNVLVLFVCLYALTLRGTVWSEKGTPIPNALITAVHNTTQTSYATQTDTNGVYHFQNLMEGTYTVRVKASGYVTILKKGVKVKGKKGLNLNIILKKAYPIEEKEKDEDNSLKLFEAPKVMGVKAGRTTSHKMAFKQDAYYQEQFNTEEYQRIYEDKFKSPIDSPLSTFSIDVDTASYSNIRRFINNHQMPYKDAVRIEEMINYFNYNYTPPKGKIPFSIYSELSACPWNQKNQLIHIGIKGKELDSKSLPPSNLVFLIDVSGSMNSPAKLPLLKKSFRILVNNLSENDRVAIVVYAGAAGVVLPSTFGENKRDILAAINRLNAGGSTAGGAGIRLAYKIALQNLIPNGNNRIILATDGDFNVGVSSTSELVRMIEEKREKGVFLTILGFGTGNYKDYRMEQLADKGNGNYFYIDNILEGKKVFSNDMISTLFTIAKDVKIQVEFNPVKVKSYRLIGYENRKLNKEDFNDDTKDAGELGAGHTVTALYEIVPNDNPHNQESEIKLKYQQVKPKNQSYTTKEIATIKFRYKNPKGSKSKLIVHSVRDQVIPLRKASDKYKFSAAVAQLGLLLRDSKFKGNANYESILKLAKESKGKDIFGYRASFIQMVEKVSLLSPK